MKPYNQKEKQIIGLSHRYVVFVDETGDPTFHKDISIYDNPSVFPIITITALIVSVAVYKDITMPKIDEIKNEFFNNIDIYFHSREIRRKDGIYKIFLNDKFYLKFKQEMDNILNLSSVKFISCSITKGNFYKKRLILSRKQEMSIILVICI